MPKRSFQFGEGEKSFNYVNTAIIVALCIALYMVYIYAFPNTYLAGVYYLEPALVIGRPDVTEPMYSKGGSNTPNTAPTQVLPLSNDTTGTFKWIFNIVKGSKDTYTIRANSHNLKYTFLSVSSDDMLIQTSTDLGSLSHWKVTKNEDSGYYVIQCDAAPGIYKYLSVNGDHPTWYGPGLWKDPQDWNLVKP